MNCDTSYNNTALIALGICFTATMINLSSSQWNTVLWRNTHSDMKQASNGLVVPGAAVGHSHSVHTRAPQDGVLSYSERKQSFETLWCTIQVNTIWAISYIQLLWCVAHSTDEETPTWHEIYKHGTRLWSVMAFQTYLVSAKAFNEGISFLHTSVHHKGNSYGQATQDFLMLCLLSVAYHVLNGLGWLGAQHDQTQGQACSFTWEVTWYCERCSINRNLHRKSRNMRPTQ